jgi:colanic acid/amylovoran biosynthesis protein
MAENKKILIIQSYNANKGDNSVISAMLSSLTPYNYSITLTAFNSEKAKNEYNIPAYDYLISAWNIKNAKTKFFLLWEFGKEILWSLYSLFVLWFLKFKIVLPLPKNKEDIIKSYQEADLVVLPGGHFFSSYNSIFNNLSHFYALRFAQLLGKKTMAYAQSIGPFDGFTGWVEKKLSFYVLRRADIVTFRESSSMRLYPYKNACLTAEAVFLQPIVKLDYVFIDDYFHKQNDEIIVGVTIHHIYYKHYFEREEYVKIMAGIFNKILRDYKSEILIISMEDSYLNNGGDRIIAKEMVNFVNEKERVKIVDKDLTSMEIANIISQVDVFIGTKTHSIVYALKTGTPVLSISYQKKSTEFMKQFCIEDYAIDMGKLSVSEFMNIFNKLMQERNAIKNILLQQYLAVKKSAAKNNILLKNLLENG